jgi:hypothetical protein
MSIRTLVSSERRCASHRTYRYVTAQPGGRVCCAGDDLDELCDECRHSVQAAPPAVEWEPVEESAPTPPSLGDAIRALRARERETPAERQDRLRQLLRARIVEVR